MGVYSTTESAVRQSLSWMLGDCILCTASAGDKTTYTVATTNPVQFYNKASDFFNSTEQYEAYCYEGTNIGTSHLVTDWGTHILTLTPGAAANYTTSSKLELHRLFQVAELRDALNRAINFYAKKYLIDDTDDTSITLVESTSNDDKTLYTYEYTLPTDLFYIQRVTTEGSVSGIKLTGTVSGAFTLGETVEGGTSGATGILSYGPEDGTYILVREVDGTFEVGETVEGATSGETCSAITSVDSETVGTGKFPLENVIERRDITIVKSSSPKIKFDERHYAVVADLRIRLEGQGKQAEVDSDTDAIYLPPHELVEVAATFLPFSKIEGNNLTATFNKCMETRARVEARPPVHPYANSMKVYE
jgi:hypothetical protein